MPAPESQYSDDPERLKLENERLRARLAELERSEFADAARIAEMVESSDDAIIGRTLEGVIRSWNKGAERLYGFVS
jgi:PAS domain-containing protein